MATRRPSAASPAHIRSPSTPPGTLAPSFSSSLSRSTRFARSRTPSPPLPRRRRGQRPPCRPGRGQEKRCRRLRRLHHRIGAEELQQRRPRPSPSPESASTAVSIRRRPSLTGPLDLLRLPRVAPRHRYYETDAAAAPIDYVVDEPFLPEQPDAGAQEPDATVDDDSYYTGGAYYYVQAADDDQE
ncbi:hypothetical protein VPH35_038483 [Triticum aestivum]